MGRALWSVYLGMLLVQKRTVMPRRVLTPKVINVDTPLPSCEAQPSSCPLRPRVAKRFWMGDIFAHACRSPARGRPSCWGSEPKSRSLELGRLWSVALPGARRGHNASVTGLMWSNLNRDRGCSTPAVRATGHAVWSRGRRVRCVRLPAAERAPRKNLPHSVERRAGGRGRPPDRLLHHRPGTS